MRELPARSPAVESRKRLAPAATRPGFPHCASSSMPPPRGSIWESTRSCPRRVGKGQALSTPRMCGGQKSKHTDINWQCIRIHERHPSTFAVCPGFWRGSFSRRRDTVETGGKVRALVVRPRVALRFQTLYWLSAQCEDKASDPSAPPVLPPTTASLRGLPRNHSGRRTGRARARETSVAPPVA